MLLGDKGTAISKGEGFANYSSIQTFHGSFTKNSSVGSIWEAQVWMKSKPIFLPSFSTIA